MFVFRDFDSEHENLERICQMFEEDISKIWKDMTKVLNVSYSKLDEPFYIASGI